MSTFLDNFDGSSVDTGKWSTYINGGSIGVSGGNVSLSANGTKANMQTLATVASGQDVDVTFNVVSSSGTYPEAWCSIMTTRTGEAFSDYITVLQSSWNGTLRLYTNRTGGAGYSYEKPSWSIIWGAHTLRIVFTASTRNIKVYINGVLQIDVTPDASQIPNGGAVAALNVNHWTSCGIVVNSISGTYGPLSSPATALLCALV